MKEVLRFPTFVDVQGFSQSDAFRTTFSWMETQDWFDPQLQCFYSYELCNLAKQHVRENDMEDYSIAEMLYVQDQLGVGWAGVFLSHAQLEPLDDTMKAIESWSQ